jgi:hypothetical protein
MDMTLFGSSKSPSLHFLRHSFAHLLLHHPNLSDENGGRVGFGGGDGTFCDMAATRRSHRTSQKISSMMNSRMMVGDPF